MDPERRPRGIGRPETAAVLALVVVLEVAVGLVSRAAELNVALFSAVGLAVGLVAALPLRRWAETLGALAVLGVAARLLTGSDLVESGLFSAMHVLGAAAGALVLTHALRRPAALRTGGDVARLLGAAGVVGVVAGCGEGLLIPELGGLGASLATLFVASHALSVVALAPLVLTAQRSSLRGRGAELAVQAALLAGTTGLVFLSRDSLPLAFLVLPLLVWAAMRFPLAVVATQNAVFAASAAALTAFGRGPFGDLATIGEASAVTIGVVLPGFVIALATTALALGVSTQERVLLAGRVLADQVRFQRTFTDAPVGMLLVRLNARGERTPRVAEVNQRACTALGVGRDDVLGEPLDVLFATSTPLSEVIEALLRGRVETWASEAEVRTRPGARLDVSLTHVATDDAESLFSVHVRDLTEYRETRRQLDDVTRLADSTLDTVGCVVLVTDDEGVVVRVNNATAFLTGWGAQQLVGRPVWETPLSPLDRSGVEALFLWPNRSGQPVLSEQVARHRDGGTLRLVWSSNIVRDEGERARYAVLTGMDVTAERTSAGMVSHLLGAAITTALIGIDTGGVVTVFSSGAEHLLGRSAEEVVGTPFVDLLDPEELERRTGCSAGPQAFIALVGGLSRMGESPARDWTWIDRRGRPLTVSMTLSMTDEEVTDHVGFLCVGRDVTEQRRSQEALVEALDKERSVVERLQALDHAKDEFVSTVSHELRTPVTSILGYTELLQDGALGEPDPSHLPVLEKIHRNSERLIRICEDLLLLSGLDTPSTASHLEQVDLNEALRAVHDNLLPALRQRPLSLVVEVPPTPTLVQGDRAALERAVHNLVENALKFTDDDGRVEMTLHREDHTAIVRVADTGIGIPPAEVGYVFDRFFRAERAQHLAIPGTGLGLSIVAGIVESHGGRVEVDSTEGAGTVMTVRLPALVPLSASGARASGSRH